MQKIQYNQIIVLDTSPHAQARYKLIVDAFAADIRSGRLPPGTLFPTHRHLAAREGIALVTATRAYAELEVRADQVAMALVRERISVSTAEPFATSAQLPHALRLALGSVELEALPQALEKVRRVIGNYTY